jgi:hypothetical protein
MNELGVWDTDPCWMGAWAAAPAVGAEVRGARRRGSDATHPPSRNWTSTAARRELAPPVPHLKAS